MDEFDLIDDILAILGDVATGTQVLLGPGDDCAVTRVPVGKAVASSIDTLVADVHFPARAAPELIGYRAMAVNLSDLAAMGAEPAYALLALTLPEADSGWTKQFALGVARCCREYSCSLVGGNLARGPLNITVSVHGLCGNHFLSRSGAQPGDVICVTGPLGAASQALEHPALEQQACIDDLITLAPADARYPLRRYYLPEPKLAVGKALVEIANAAIDLSDGLAADLTHVCRASGVGAELNSESIPIWQKGTLETALGAGDDYELCLSIPEEKMADAVLAARKQGGDLMPVGVIRSDPHIFLKRQGSIEEIPPEGYQHFR